MKDVRKDASLTRKVDVKFFDVKKTHEGQEYTSRVCGAILIDGESVGDIIGGWGGDNYIVTDGKTECGRTIVEKAVNLRSPSLSSTQPDDRDDWSE